MDREEERLLVAELVRGERDALARVFALCSNRIFSFLWRLTRRRELAEDLTQDTFVRFARATSSLEPDTRIDAYLFRIARNAFISHRRWERLDFSRLLVWGHVQDDFVASPHAEVSSAELLNVLESALSRLSHEHREVLLLIGAEGLSADVVANILSLEAPAMRKRLSRAREALREQIAHEENRRGT